MCIWVGSYFHSFWASFATLMVAFVALMKGWKRIWLRFLGGNQKMAEYGAAIDRSRRSWLCHQCGTVLIE